MIWLPASPVDAGQLARAMRLSDVMELRCNAITFGRMEAGWSVERELAFQFEHYHPFTLWDGADMIGMGGVAPVPHFPQIGAAWFLGTHLADARPIGMTRACKRMKAYGEGRFEKIGNIVPAFMEKRIKWLEFLGFDIDRDKANVPDGYVAFWSHPDGPKDGPAAP